MSVLVRFYQNHVLANLTYGLVLLLGLFAYGSLAREEFPAATPRAMSVWVDLPGLAAEDIEQRAASPFEQLLRARLSDIRTLSSTIGAGYMEVVIHFNPLDKATYEKRGVELRRELQGAYASLFPKEAATFWVWGDTGSIVSNIGSLLVRGNGDPERLKATIREVRRELERIPGIEKLDYFGYYEPEIHIAFHPDKLAGLSLSPRGLIETVRTYVRDEAAGPIALGDREWLVRIAGSSELPARLADLPITTGRGVIRLGDLADISRSDNFFMPLPRSNGMPTGLFSLLKKNAADAFELMGKVKRFIAQRNAERGQTGVEILLVEDETARTETAIALMEGKAWRGLALVLAITWLFLGSRLAGLCTLAVPFALSGTFLVLQAAGMTLNTSVLLGIMIALGMLVDYAVIVVEAIAHRIRQGVPNLEAALQALREVGIPVFCSFLTTVAAFLPLALLPGFLGSIMKVVPVAVTAALFAALIEALWMLPAQVAAWSAVVRPSRLLPWRMRATRWLRWRYTRLLLACLRQPLRGFAPVALTFAAVGVAYFSGGMKTDFFPKAPTRSFEINVKFPAGTTPAHSMDILGEMEARVRTVLSQDELLATVALPGSSLRVYLQPQGRRLPDAIAAVEPQVKSVTGPLEVSLQGQSTGGPQGAPIKVKLTGSDFHTLKPAAEALQAAMARNPALSNLHSDFQGGAPQLDLRLKGEAIQRAGLDPEAVLHTVKLLVRGEVAASYREGPESVGIRVLAHADPYQDIDALLRQIVVRPGGGAVPLRELLEVERKEGPAMIHHYNFRRVITLEANVDDGRTSIPQANTWIAKEWDKLQTGHPDIKLDLAGEIEDIQESLNGLWQLGLLGIGLIFLILGAQYRNYLQPALILLKVPMGFAGIGLGLLVSREPISLYTLYGGVALAGITVNSAILLFSAANERVESGVSVLHATVYAARRRLTPILITSIATLAGLLPLALTSDESATLWKPVATAIVWGLGFSTLLTLFIVPLIYRLAMGWATRNRDIRV